MTTKIPTKEEKKMMRYSHIIALYQKINDDNPHASHHEICEKVAENKNINQKSWQRIDQIIRGAGVRKPKCNK